MMSKPGKVLGLVKFPRMTAHGRVVREDAVDGLLISSEIEPGFSGGPTCNERGEVVGVNVTKDVVHRGQNGAVSVTAVARLLEADPAAAGHEPTAATCKRCSRASRASTCSCPIERRVAAREDEFVSAGDLPRLDN